MSCCNGWEMSKSATSGRNAPTRNAAPPAAGKHQASLHSCSNQSNVATSIATLFTDELRIHHTSGSVYWEFRAQGGVETLPEGHGFINRPRGAGHVAGNERISVSSTVATLPEKQGMTTVMYHHDLFSCLAFNRQRKLRPIIFGGSKIRPADRSAVQAFPGGQSAAPRFG